MTTTGSNNFSSFKRTAKRFFYTGLLVGSFFLGEYVHPVKTISQKIKYHNISAEDGFPRDFRELDRVVIINDRNRAETYFGNVEDSVLHPVRPDYHTRREIGKQVDTYLERNLSKLDSVVGAYSSRLFDTTPDTVPRKDTVCPIDSVSWLEEKLSGIQTYLDDTFE